MPWRAVPGSAGVVHGLGQTLKLFRQSPVKRSEDSLLQGS